MNVHRKADMIARQILWIKSNKFKLIMSQAPIDCPGCSLVFIFDASLCRHTLNTFWEELIDPVSLSELVLVVWCLVSHCLDHFILGFLCFVFQGMFSVLSGREKDGHHLSLCLTWSPACFSLFLVTLDETPSLRPGNGISEMFKLAESKESTVSPTVGFKIWRMINQCHFQKK